MASLSIDSGSVSRPFESDSVLIDCPATLLSSRLLPTQYVPIDDDNDHLNESKLRLIWISPEKISKTSRQPESILEEIYDLSEADVKDSGWASWITDRLHAGSTHMIDTIRLNRTYIMMLRKDFVMKPDKLNEICKRMFGLTVFGKVLIVRVDQCETWFEKPVYQFPFD